MTDLNHALDALVPQADPYGDWDDVLRRAGVGRKPPRRTVLIALLVLAAIAVPVIVAAALTRTNIIFTTSKPASNVIKKRFLDMGFGAPPQFAMKPLAAQAREVGTFRFGGRGHKLWVAPTRQGGYCYMFEEGQGGCVGKASERRPFGASEMQNDAWPGTATIQIAGVVGDAVARVEVQYADGTTSSLPFVFVSAPIDAGFFVFDVPSSHLTAATRATAVVARDQGGHEVARQTFYYGAPRAPRRRPPMPKPHVLPPSPATTPPTEPAQRGTGDGYSVVAGANGVAVFKAQKLTPFAAGLLGQSAGYSCFKLVHEFGIFSAKGSGYERLFARSGAIRIYGLPHPWDGCEIGGSYGHRWPDRNASHTAVEIPLTAKGRRYFADRAAARDLALFVRTRDVQRIRRETGSALARDLGRYPVVRLPSPTVPPPQGRIGWTRTANGVIFVERSSTGRRFSVEVHNGKIVRTNLKGYALVF